MSALDVVRGLTGVPRLVRRIAELKAQNAQLLQERDGLGLYRAHHARLTGRARAPGIPSEGAR